MPERERFILHERIEGCFFKSSSSSSAFLLPTLFSLSHTPTQPTAGAFIFPLSCPSLLLPFYSSCHLPSIPLSSSLFCSSLALSLPPSVSLSLTSLRVRGWRQRWLMELLGPSSHDFECVVLLCVIVSTVPRPCPRPALFHKHPRASVIFSAVFTSANQTSR